MNAMNAQLAEKTKIERSLEIFYAQRKQVDDFSQQSRHDCFFYRGKWYHRCSCTECKQKQVDDIGT